MKNNKKTFAQRAKDIQNKYKRANFDPIEQADMEAELQTLMKEQETVRESMGLTQPQEGMPQEQFKGGGKIKYPGGGDLFPGYNTLDLSQYYQQPLTPQQLAQRGQPWQKPSQQTSTGQSSSQGNIGIPSANQAGVNRNPNERWMANEADMVANNIGNRIQPMGIAGEGYQSPSEMAAAMNQLTVQGQPTSSQGGGQSWWDKNKQYAPYALSGLSNIASNLLMANMAKRNQPRMSAAMATPEKINLEPQAEALRGQAGVAKNIASRNARNLGLNPMQAMASMSAAGTGIDRNLGDALTNLYMQQEGANVGAANQFSMMNAQAQNRANMLNTQLGQEGLNKKLGYTGAALGTLPGVMKDIRMDKADKDMRDVMRSYYESMGRNYMVEGDIFEKDGFRYRVKNNKLKKVGKVK